jgi:hypothetical protein
MTDEKVAAPPVIESIAEAPAAKLPWHPPTAELHGIEIVQNGFAHFNIVGDGTTTCTS